jgi:hypothetical protein
MPSRVGWSRPRVSENPLVIVPSCGCTRRRFVERTIQFSRTEGALGSGVGGDTVVARFVTVKSSMLISSSSSEEMRKRKQGLEESRIGADRRRPWRRLAESYSQAFQSEGLVTTKDALRSGAPRGAVCVVGWAADFSHAGLPVKEFLLGSVSLSGVVLAPACAGRRVHPAQAGRACNRRGDRAPALRAITCRLARSARRRTKIPRFRGPR